MRELLRGKGAHADALACVEGVPLDALAALPAGEAERKIALTSQTTNQGDTVKDIVWQTLVHNSYHVGQVVLLRQALGAWPPPSGTDSW